MDTERVTFYITKRQKQQVTKRSQAEGLPMAELIRRALDAYLAWDDPTYHPTLGAPNKERRSHPPHE